MWLEDFYKLHELKKQEDYERLITQNLMDKYGLSYADLIPLAFNDDVWEDLPCTSTRQQRRSTDDGCEHYRDVDGRYYVLDYHFHNDEWREVPKDKYSMMCT